MKRVKIFLIFLIYLIGISFSLLPFLLLKPDPQSIIPPTRIFLVVKIFGVIYAIAFTTTISYLSFKKNLVLDNPVRHSIYQTIIANPGIHYNELRIILELAAGQLRWHLRMLIRFNYIKQKHLGNYIVFFQMDYPTKNTDKYKAKQLLLEKSKSTLEVYRFILFHPNSSQKQIQTSLDLSQSTISYHLKKLRSMNFIIEVNSNDTENVKLYKIKNIED